MLKVSAPVGTVDSVTPFSGNFGRTRPDLGSVRKIEVPGTAIGPCYRFAGDDTPSLDVFGFLPGEVVFV